MTGEDELPMGTSDGCKRCIFGDVECLVGTGMDRVVHGVVTRRQPRQGLKEVESLKGRVCLSGGRMETRSCVFVYVCVILAGPARLRAACKRTGVCDGPSEN